MIKKYAAFSLVEMLMALLVASLLLAALAPVMTKRMSGETITANVTGNGVRGDYSRTFYEDFEWTVPGGVNTVNITAVGAGGGGGGATYGYKEITASETNWVVPDGVTKIRVFMTGAGGGGASGGDKRQYAFGNSNKESGTKDFLTTGQSTWIIPDGAKAPELDNKCTLSGTTQWELVSNTATKITPNVNAILSVTACGGGGGGSGRSWYGYFSNGGGSGGYKKNEQVIVLQDAVYIRVPGGGGGGGGAGGMDAVPGNSGNSGGYSAGGGGGGCHS